MACMRLYGMCLEAIFSVVSSLPIDLVTVLKLLFLKLSMTFFWQWMRASCQFGYSLTYLQLLLPLTMIYYSTAYSMCLVFKASYLTKRFQIISTQGTHSDQIELCCGVPQGSVLGPILFILYTQPLTGVILKHPVSHVLYTDDTQVYKLFNLDDCLSSSLCV